MDRRAIKLRTCGGYALLFVYRVFSCKIRDKVLITLPARALGGAFERLGSCSFIKVPLGPIRGVSATPPAAGPNAIATATVCPTIDLSFA
jgi:hypothetical protein